MLSVAGKSLGPRSDTVGYAFASCPANQIDWRTHAERETHA